MRRGARRRGASRAGRAPAGIRAGLPWQRLAGGGSRAAGSLLVAMLVLMTISSIFLSIATTRWTFLMQREREKELIFRGVQIAKGIEEWQQQTNAPPTSLVQMTKPPRPTLRKAWLDPMTVRYDDEGEPIEGTGEWSVVGPIPPPGAGTGTGTSRRETVAEPARIGATEASGRGVNTQPILGVQSTSDEVSIGRYANGEAEEPYSEWVFRGIGLGTGGQRLEGGYDLPRPPGFGGLRRPGGEPVR